MKLRSRINLGLMAANRACAGTTFTYRKCARAPSFCLPASLLTGKNLYTCPTDTRGYTGNPPPGKITSSQSAMQLRPWPRLAVVEAEATPTAVEHMRRQPAAPPVSLYCVPLVVSRRDDGERVGSQRAAEDPLAGSHAPPGRIALGSATLSLRWEKWEIVLEMRKMRGGRQTDWYEAPGRMDTRPMGLCRCFFF
jgi:hypothetical protein